MFYDGTKHWLRVVPMIQYKQIYSSTCLSRYTPQSNVLYSEKWTNVFYLEDITVNGMWSFNKGVKIFPQFPFFFLPATFQNSLSRVKVRCLLQQCACVCVIFNQHHGNRCHKGDEIVAVIWLPSLCHFQPFISISNFFWFAFWWDCQETFQLQNTCTMWTP